LLGDFDPAVALRYTASQKGNTVHITPHAGLRKMLFDKFIMFLLNIVRNISY
jgi:hypothetical protein